MAIVFKSNIKATNPIRDKSGYSGPLDYALNAISSMNTAILHGLDVPLSDVLLSERNSTISVIENEKLEYGFVDKNQLRFSYLPELSTYGIVCDQSSFDNIELPSSQSVYLSTDYDGYIFCIYSLVGRATLSALDVDVISGDGSISSPMFFRRKGVTSPAVKRSGGATTVCCTLITPYHQTPFIPYFSSNSSQDGEKLFLKNVNYGEAGTVVLRYAEPSRLIPAENTADKPLLQIIISDQEYIAVGKSINTERLVVRYFQKGMETFSNKYFDMIAPNMGVNTVALAWDYKSLKLSINGRSISLPPFSTNILPSRIKLLSAIDSWIPQASNNALLNLVYYERALDSLELDLATKF